MVNDILIKHNFFDIVVKIWDHCHSIENADDNYLVSPSYCEMKRVCCSLSETCVNSCKEAYRHKLVFERFMREFTLPELRVQKLNDEKKRDLIEATLEFLYNTLWHYNANRELVRRNEGIQRLLSYCNTEHLIIKLKIMLLLAYSAKEEDNDKIFAGGRVIGFIMAILKNAFEDPHHNCIGFSASKLVCGLNKLAINDRNKTSIVENGVLPHLTNMMTNENFLAEYAPAAECLWSLSFDTLNKECIQTEPDLMEAVRRLLNDPKSDEATRKACEGIIFNLEGKNSSDSPPSASTAGDTKKQHIMISYQWDVQPIILKGRNILRDNGFNVWLDVDNMKGSILSAMADAVENASVLVVGVTERYKNSNACRTEAVYAYRLSKPIAPLLLEPHYKADGWLGALLGMQLYVDVSSEDVLNAKVDEIVRMIRLKASCQNVKDGLPPLLASFDGVALEQLFRLLKRSPGIYYNSLRVDLKLSLLQSLQFTHFLEEL